MEKIIELEGHVQVVTVYPKKIVISGKKGFMGAMATGGTNQEIRIKDITGIEFKENDNWTKGHIVFNTAATVTKGATGLLSGLSSEPNPNRVIFNKKQNDSFVELKQKIEEIMDQMDSNQGTTVQAPSAADEIQKFSTLLKDGLITQDEFDEKKKKLLDL